MCGKQRTDSRQHGEQDTSVSSQKEDSHRQVGRQISEERFLRLQIHAIASGRIRQVKLPSGNNSDKRFSL